LSKKEIEEKLESIQRAFMLMIGYGRANLFRDLNRRSSELLKELKSCQGGVKREKYESY